ncbi:hypothetical protein FA125_27100 [Pseudomonas aeruginosa]|nr:hypothetical protein [Pseudomonas aeruginosa]
MSSTQHQLIKQCATRLRGIVEALDNIHDTSPQRWSTDLDDVHSSAESLLALINDQAPTLDSQGLALRTIAEFPCPEQDNMPAANMRQIALAALSGAGASSEPGNPGGEPVSGPGNAGEQAEADLERPEAWARLGAYWRNGFKHAEAQHKRVVEALRVDRDMWRDAAARGRSDVVAYIAERAKLLEEHDVALAEVGALKAELQSQRERNTELIFKLGSATNGWGRCEKERDAALARVDALAVQVLKLGGTISFAHHRTDQAGQVPQAWLDVQAERLRQVEAEGWMPEHDDAHSHGQMARAAACYALAGSSAPNDGTAALLVSLAWPWDEQWWKPSTARRDMVKACALGLAEIERLDRVAASQGGPSDA